MLIRLALALFEFFVFLQLIVSAVPYALGILLMSCIVFWNESDKAFAHSSEFNFITYRKLQVFEKLINACVRNRIFLVIAKAAPAAQILTGFVTVHYHSSMQHSHVVCLLILLFISVIFTVIFFGLAGNIYTKSGRWLVTEQNRNQSQKIGRRVISSMMPLRIFLGLTLWMSSPRW